MEEIIFLLCVVNNTYHLLLLYMKKYLCSKCHGGNPALLRHREGGYLGSLYLLCIWAVWKILKKNFTILYLWKELRNGFLSIFPFMAASNGIYSRFHSPGD